MTEIEFVRIVVGLLICVGMVTGAAYLMVWIIWAYSHADDWTDRLEEHVAHHRAKRRRPWKS